MELIAKISKGTKMDQIYLPKNRTGLNTGQYVVINSLEDVSAGKNKENKPYFYNVAKIEPLKLQLIERIFSLVQKQINCDNVFITGSFLEPGFRFNDLDILIISDDKKSEERIKSLLEEAIAISAHVIIQDNSTLLSGLASDPLYEMMLSKCVSLKRKIFNVNKSINYKLLDLHLLKSKTLIENFDILNGNEKYYLVMNMVSILLFIKKDKLTKSLVNRKIEEIFDIKIDKIKDNLIDKKDFIKKYSSVYTETFNLIMDGIKYESK